MPKQITPGDKVVIFGAGLVGSMLGILLAQKGFRVEIHEKRPDLRYKAYSNLRSINLALSHRGWRALEMAGLAAAMKKIALPMYGRVLHPTAGEIGFLAYGRDDQCIYSVSRYKLNCFLLDEAEKLPNLKVYFESKAEKFAFDKSLAYVSDIEGLRHRIEADAFFGTDGAFSAMRYEMMREDQFFYQQAYIEHGYKEFTLPPNVQGDWAIRPDGLHIWPRKSFMMIALPNEDHTFTCTLFFPFQGPLSFESLKKTEQIAHLFQTEFPDLVPLIPDYQHQFATHPTASLVSIRCAPWNNHNFLLMGDAAHAIVPFYGQGMIAGFEDCRLLMEQIDNEQSWENLFAHFYQSRRPDADAISTLALENFVEMRDLVADPRFLMKRKLEGRIVKLGVEGWLPLYTMVTFTDLPYSQALARGRKQNASLEYLLTVAYWNQLPEDQWDSLIIKGLEAEKSGLLNLQRSI